MPIELKEFPGWKPAAQIAESDMSGDRNVDPDDNSEGGEQPIFRPHPFALGRGEGGATVAYGQFFWKVAAMLIDYEDQSGVHNRTASQDVIDGLTAVVPTIDDADGGFLVSNEQNSHNLLSGWGDVYLYWEVDLDETDGSGGTPITACYVTTSTPALDDVEDLDPGATASDRLGTSGGTEVVGRYRIKLGTVPETGAVDQLIASDVHWPMFVLKRSYTVV